MISNSRALGDHDSWIPFWLFFSSDKVCLVWPENDGCICMMVSTWRVMHLFLSTVIRKRQLWTNAITSKLCYDARKINMFMWLFHIILPELFETMINGTMTCQKRHFLNAIGTVPQYIDKHWIQLLQNLSECCSDTDLCYTFLFPRQCRCMFIHCFPLWSWF